MKGRIKQPLPNRLVSWASRIIFLLATFYCALLVTQWADRSLPALLLLYLLIVALRWLNVLMHEAGHLIFGLFSGRRFHALSILGLHLVRKPEGGFRVGWLRMPGISGSCSTIPTREDAPFTLHLLGGAIMDLLTGIICGILAWQTKPLIFPDIGWSYLMHPIHIPLVLLAVYGLVGGVTNLLPLQLLTGYTDGYQLRLLRQNPTAREDYRQTEAIGMMEYQGKRLREMPDAWFAPRSVETLTTPYAVRLAIFRFSRLFSQQEYFAAMEAAHALLNSTAPLTPFDRLGLIRTAALCEVLTDGPGPFCQQLDSPQIQRLHQISRYTPGTQLTLYAVAMLIKQDPENANMHYAAYRRIARRYPYPESLLGDEEFIALIEEKARLHCTSSQAAQEEIV